MVRTLKIAITIRAKGVQGNWKYWKVRCEVGPVFFIICHPNSILPIFSPLLEWRWRRSDDMASRPRRCWPGNFDRCLSLERGRLAPPPPPISPPPNIKEGRRHCDCAASPLKWMHVFLQILFFIQCTATTRLDNVLC